MIRGYLMGRFRLCLVLLLPVLAACAGERAKPASDIPTPALSHAGLLDGGNVTPIEKAVLVRFAPFPSAGFERTIHVDAFDASRSYVYDEWSSGSISATAERDL